MLEVIRRISIHSLVLFFTSEDREPQALLEQDAAVVGKWPWVYPCHFDCLPCGGLFHVARGLKCCIPWYESSPRKCHLVNEVDK